jgi:hypothetical protein
MNRERHIEYANSIDELQKKAGEIVKNEAINHLKKLFELSKGNMQLFKVLMIKTQKQFMKTTLRAVIQEQMKARKLGKAFQ